MTNNYKTKDVKIKIKSRIDEEKKTTVILSATHLDKTIAFGKKGDVEFERFIIHNPSTTVPDQNGEIELVAVLPDGTENITRFRYAPEAALEQTLHELINITGKDNKNMIKGKVGNTVSTFYPDASPETTSVDGHAGSQGSAISWASRRTSSGTNSDDSGTIMDVRTYNPSSGFINLFRGIILFDTASIPDTDGIDSATLSINVNWRIGSRNWYLVTSNPASNTAIASSDYDYTDFGTTNLADAISYASTGAKTTNLNASGLAEISKTGITKFGIRTDFDADDVDLGNGFGDSGGGIYTSEQGTTFRPKLVVTHSAPTADENALAMCNF